MKTPANLLAIVSIFCAASAVAQTPLDAPPPLPAATPPSAAPTPGTSNSNRRTVARLPEADRAKLDAPPPLAPSTEPADSDLLPPAHPAAAETRIEQKRQGNRVVEIIVTPQGSSSSYVILNREGRPPLTTQELSSGLSTPRFLRFDF